jgi:hypothetical protein
MKRNGERAFERAKAIEDAVEKKEHRLKEALKRLVEQEERLRLVRRKSRARKLTAYVVLGHSAMSDDDVQHALVLPAT